MKESFVLYTKYFKQIAKLDMEERGVLFTALMCYQTDEDLPQMNEITEMVFSFIADKISEDNERYERTCEARRAAGAMGGAPRGNKNAKKTTETSKQAKQAKGCDNANAENERDFESLEESEKQPKQAKQAKQPDNECDCDYDCDIYIQPTACAGAREETEEKMTCAEFLQKYPNVEVDTNIAAYGINWVLLDEKFQESKKYLQSRVCTLSWIKREYPAILKGKYKDKDFDCAESERKANEEWFDKTFGGRGA